MRVTGDCFRAERVFFRFDAGDPRVDFFFAAAFEPAVRFALVFLAVLLREPAR